MKDTLKQYSDDQLKAVIAAARDLLEERDRQRKDEAARRIREIAAASGLTVAVKTRKKRGRPAGSKTTVPRKPSTTGEQSHDPTDS